MDTNEFIEQVSHLWDLEYNLVPAADKFPVAEWKAYQTTRYPRQKLIEQLSTGRYNQVFAIGGKISNGLTAVDIDIHSHNLEGLFLNALPPALRDLFTLHERTQHLGLHLPYRSEQSLRSKRLALFYNGSVSKDGRLIEQPLIELKGEGGGYICAPSQGEEPGTGYVIEMGSYDNIPYIPPAKEDLAIEIATKLDLRPLQEMDALKAYKAGSLENTDYNQLLLKKAMLRYGAPVQVQVKLPEVAPKPEPPAPKQETPAPRLTFDKPLPPLANQMTFNFEAGTPSMAKPIILPGDLTNYLTPEQKAAFASLSDAEQEQHLRRLIEPYLQSKGIDTSGKIRCPSPAEIHVDKVPSASLNKEKTMLTCWSHPGCDAGKMWFSIFDLVEIDFGIPFPKSIQKTKELFGLAGSTDTIPNQTSDMLSPGLSRTSEEIKARIDEWHSHVDQTDIFEKRGVSALVEKYYLGFDPQTNRAVIPTGNCSCYNARSLDPTAEHKYTKPSNVPFKMFNEHLLLNHDRPLFVLEGEFCAMSVELAGGLAMALGGTSNVDRLVKIMASVPKAEHEQMPPLILCMDNDSAGKAAQAKAASELKELGVPFICYEDIFDSYKDANERWIADPEDLKEAVALGNEPEKLKVHLAERYQITHSVISLHEQLLAGLTDPNVNAVLPTGIVPVDNLLQGGVKNEFITMGAVSSLGKSTFCWQISENIAASGRDVLYVSLEMKATTLIEKSLTRRANIAGVLRQRDGLPLSSHELYQWAKSSHSSEETAELMQLIDEFEETAGKHLFIIEAEGLITATEVRAKVEEHAQATGAPPVLVLDYLQLLTAPTDSWDVKRTVDQAVVIMRQISRDYLIPVIAISSISRAFYNQPIALNAFKESGGIEFTSDCVFGLQMAGIGNISTDTVEGRKLLSSIRTAVNQRQANGGTIPLDFAILKNRSGMRGETQFGLCPRAQSFAEVPDPEQWLRTVWSCAPTTLTAGSQGTIDYISHILGYPPDQSFLENLNKNSWQDGANDCFEDGQQLPPCPFSVTKPSLGIVDDFAQFA